MIIDRVMRPCGMILLVASLGLTACGQPNAISATGPTIEMYKRASCQCCSKWAAHMKHAGFNVVAHNESSLFSLKSQLGVPQNLWSCHTAVVDGFVIEGHVPVRDIERLLTERPRGRGLAVPGMPIGSPGMEQGDRHDSYDVLLFEENGGTKVYASH